MSTSTALTPSRRQMIEMLISHDGIAEYSASLTFKRGDISWGLKRKLVGTRSGPFDRPELYATDAGRAALQQSR